MRTDRGFISKIRYTYPDSEEIADIRWQYFLDFMVEWSAILQKFSIAPATGGASQRLPRKRWWEFWKNTTSIREKNIASVKGSKRTLDGRDYARAIPVGNAAEQDAWVGEHFPGAKIENRTLSEYQGIQVGVADVCLSDGSRRTIYFNMEKAFTNYIQNTSKS
jgi:hypothetical protein